MPHTIASVTMRPVTSPPTPLEDTTQRPDRERPDAKAANVVTGDTDPTIVAVRGAQRDDAVDETVVLAQQSRSPDVPDPASDVLPAIVADSSSFAPAWLLGVAAVAVIGAAGVGFYALREAPAPSKMRPPGVSAGEAGSPAGAGTNAAPSRVPSVVPSQPVPAGERARNAPERQPGMR